MTSRIAISAAYVTVVVLGAATVSIYLGHGAAHTLAYIGAAAATAAVVLVLDAKRRATAATADADVEGEGDPR